MNVEELVALLEYWGACAEGFDWARRNFGPDCDARRVYETCTMPDWIEWLIDKTVAIDRDSVAWFRVTNSVLDTILAHYRDPDVETTEAFLAELDRFKAWRKEFPEFDYGHLDYEDCIVSGRAEEYTDVEAEIVQVLCNATASNAMEVRLANILYNLPKGQPYAVTLCDILRGEFPWDDLVDDLTRHYEGNVK